MRFKGPSGYGRIMNICMNAVMCVALSFVMMWVAQQRVPEGVVVLTPLAYFISCITAFGIGYVVVDLIPVFQVGTAAARKLGLRGPAGYAATVMTINVIVTTIIGFFMTIINAVGRAGLPEAFISWLATYPLMLLVGFIVQLAVMKPFMLLAARITGFSPESSVLLE